jgi:cytochrome P450
MMNNADHLHALYLDPHLLFVTMRESKPLYRSSELDAWVLTSYEDVCAALRDPRLSVVEELKRMEALPPADRLALQPLARIFVSWGNRAAPEAHAEFIKLLKRHFTPSHVAGQRPRIEQILTDLIDTAVRRGEMDVVNDIAHPLAMTFMAQLLGLPADTQSVAMYLRCSNLISQLLEMGDREQLFGCQRGMMELADFVRPYVEQRRQDPGADLLTVFFHADPSGEHYTDDYIIAQVLMFLVVGYHTTANQLCNGLQILFDHPEQRAAIAGDPSLIPNAFDEMMRLHGAVASVRRMPTTDIVLHGETIRAGDTLVLVLAAANRDPKMFAAPDRFDIHRKEASRQIGFTIGHFSCMGQALARLEAQVFYQTMLSRFPKLRPRNASPDWIVFRPFGRELRSMPVYFT